MFVYIPIYNIFIYKLIMSTKVAAVRYFSMALYSSVDLQVSRSCSNKKNKSRRLTLFTRGRTCINSRVEEK